MYHDVLTFNIQMKNSTLKILVIYHINRIKEKIVSFH